MAGVVQAQKATCNNSVIVIAEGGAEFQRMQSGAMDGAREEDSSSNKNNVIVTAGGGAGVWRMQSGAKEGAREEDKGEEVTTAAGGAATQEESKDGARVEGVRENHRAAEGGAETQGESKDGAKVEVTRREKRAAEGGAETQGESKDGAKEEAEMVELRRAAWESMRPERKGKHLKEGKFNERWEALKEKQAMADAEMAAQLARECRVDQHLAMRALQETGGIKIAAKVWIEKHQQRVERSGAEKRKQEKEKVATRMKTEGIKLKKNGLRLKNWQPGARYEGWDGNTWLRKDEGKWLRRRLPVGVKIGGSTLVTSGRHRVWLSL